MSLIGPALVALLLSAPETTVAPVPCPDSPPLPAYAHNDYAKPRPLWDALSLGFRGVEVDLFRLHGQMLAAHDRRSLCRERSLTALYLEPLRVRLRQCGRIVTGHEPFLLNIELKEPSTAAFETLVEVLRPYSDLFLSEGSRPPAVEVVLVGWYPARTSPATTGDAMFRVQRQVTNRSVQPTFDSSSVVRLVSLDYGKRIGWSGRGPPPTSMAEWLAALRRLRDAGPCRISRVYNVPAEPVLLRMLLESDVDLIGLEDLQQGRRALNVVKDSISRSGRSSCKQSRSVS